MVSRLAVDRHRRTAGWWKAVAPTPMTEAQEAFLPPLCGAEWGDTEPRAMRARVGYLRRPRWPPARWASWVTSTRATSC